MSIIVPKLYLNCTLKYKSSCKTIIYYLTHLLTKPFAQATLLHSKIINT